RLPLQGGRTDCGSTARNQEGDFTRLSCRPASTSLSQDCVRHRRPCAATIHSLQQMLRSLPDRPSNLWRDEVKLCHFGKEFAGTHRRPPLPPVACHEQRILFIHPPVFYICKAAWSAIVALPDGDRRSVGPGGAAVVCDVEYNDRPGVPGIPCRIVEKVMGETHAHDPVPDREELWWLSAADPVGGHIGRYGPVLMSLRG